MSTESEVSKLLNDHRFSPFELSIEEPDGKRLVRRGELTLATFHDFHVDLQTRKIYEPTKTSSVKLIKPFEYNILDSEGYIDVEFDYCVEGRLMSKPDMDDLLDQSEQVSKFYDKVATLRIFKADTTT